MPRQASELVLNNFTRGLITEATGLTYPDNSCSETFNCIFDSTGLVTRRKGIDYESGYSTNSEVRTDDHLSLYKWKNVAGQGDLTFFVTQIGRYLIFYEEDSTGALSAQKKTFEVDLNSYKSGSTNPETARCQYASINGDLFIVNPYIEPIYVRYSVSGDSITTTQIDVKIRDLDGIDSEGISFLEHRSTFQSAGISPSHHYNLLNQGWYKNVDYDTSGNTAQALQRWDSLRSDYPANTDIWWLMKDTNDVYQAVTWADRTLPGNTLAPKGHYLHDAFDLDYDSVSSGDTLSTNDTVNYSALSTYTSSTDLRPTAVASFTQRIFYAGVEAQGWNTNIYFTQIVESEKQYGLCYQKNDPTNEHLSDTLATDGGIIKIPELGKVVAMRPLGRSLLIFAENGVWSISGGESLGFRATDFSINKLSEISSAGSASFVSVGNSIIWWADNGIYIAQNENDQTSIQSLTAKTVQSFYDDIPTQSKVYAQAAYNEEANLVQWCYRSTSDNDVDTRYNYDRILNFDVALGSFYPWSVGEVDTDPAYLNGVVSTYVGDNEKFLYLVSELDTGTTFDFTFADETDTTYTDWVTVDATGIDYSSYLISGYLIQGGAMRDFQSNYVHVYQNVESGSSLKVRGRFRWANTSDSGKWSVLQEAYTHDADYDVIVARLKVRGEGRAMQLYAESTATKPFNLIGWGLWLTANQSV